MEPSIQVNNQKQQVQQQQPEKEQEQDQGEGTGQEQEQGNKQGTGQEQGQHGVTLPQECMTLSLSSPSSPSRNPSPSVTEKENPTSDPTLLRVDSEPAILSPSITATIISDDQPNVSSREPSVSSLTTSSIKPLESASASPISASFDLPSKSSKSTASALLQTSDPLDQVNSPITTTSSNFKKKKSNPAANPSKRSTMTKDKEKKSAMTSVSTVTTASMAVPVTATATASSSTISMESDSQEVAEQDHQRESYCICKSQYNEELGGMIMCDRCDQWYHYQCVYVDEDKVELVDMFICPPCESHTSNRTTYKEKCRRTECTHGSQAPLSRYCSDRCGILTVSERLSKAKISKAKAALLALETNPKVAHAEKREGLVFWNSPPAPHSLSSDPAAILPAAATSSDQSISLLQQQWFNRFQHRKLARLTRNMSLAESFHFVIDNHLDRLGTSASIGDDILNRASFTTITESLFQIQSRLSALAIRKTRIHRALDLLDSRSKLLHLVNDRVSTLPLVGVSTLTAQALSNGQDGDIVMHNPVLLPPSPVKKKKGTKAESSSSTGPRCGYDERLHWDDEPFEQWCSIDENRKILNEQLPLDGILEDEVVETTDPKLPRICAIAKRRCKRHLDWFNLRDNSVEWETKAWNTELSRVEDEEQFLREKKTKTIERIQIHKQVAQDEESRQKYWEEKKDEELALELSRQGQRKRLFVGR